MPGERVFFHGAANLFKRRLQVGGQVTVTDRRFLFVPNRLDGMTGRRRIAVIRAEINSVRVEPPGTKVARQRGLSAVLRPQVEIEYPGRTLVVTVRDPDALSAALHRPTA